MNSVEKVLWILNRLSDEPFEMTLTEIANELDTVKSGAHKILSVMTKQGFILQEPSSKKYSIGPAVYRLGNIYCNRVGIWEIAKPILIQAAEITQETVSIGIREGDIAILAYKIDSPLPIRIVENVGTKFPMNASAIGKLLAAYHNFDRVTELLNSMTFIKQTKNTLVDHDAILREYQKIRRQGYAIADEERFLDSIGIAVPIKDKNENVWSCISITAPKSRLAPGKLDRWIDLLKDKAELISNLVIQSCNT